MKKRVCILISSFDGYKDLWEPLEESYCRFWGDCPYPIYISTNFVTKGFKLFKPINSGKDKSWSEMLYKTLNKIEEEYVLLTFDDLFLYKNINTSMVNQHITKAFKIDADYYQLFPSISKKTKLDDITSKKLKNSKYRNGTVWSLWKKDVLIDLLDLEENAWEFEINGNFRSFKYDNFYTSNNIIIPYLNGVVKGKWVRKVYTYLTKDLKLKIKADERKKMSRYDNLKYLLNYYYFKLLRLI